MVLIPNDTVNPMDGSDFHNNLSKGAKIQIGYEPHSHNK